MKVGKAIAEILRREGIEIICAYPVNHMIEHAANLDIRPIIVRQERIGLHMADAISRLSSGRKIGVFVMQHGPGAENAFGGVAQAYGESVPLLVMPMGYARDNRYVSPNFDSVRSMETVTKSAEPIMRAHQVPAIFRRAFTQLKNGRGSPCLVEIPADIWNEEVPEPLEYSPVLRTRYGPDPIAVKEAVQLLSAANRPIIYAGQGVHYAQAWPQLKTLVERLAAPIGTSLGGKSAFPEDHPLSLGAGNNSVPAHLRHFLDEADLILGLGCSFTKTAFAVAMPSGKKVIHATVDPAHINKDIACDVGLIGDAALTIEALLAELDAQGFVTPDVARQSGRRLKAVRAALAGQNGRQN